MVFWQPVWSPSDIYQKVYKVFGQQTPLIQAVPKLIHLFKEEWETVEDEEWAGRLSDVHTSDSIAGVWSLLEDNSQLTIRQIELLMNKKIYGLVF